MFVVCPGKTSKNPNGVMSPKLVDVLTFLYSGKIVLFFGNQSRYLSFTELKLL